MARETLFNGQLQFAYNPVYGAYGSGIAPSPFALVAGESYTVSWNGEEYTRTAFAADTFSPGAVGLGNAAFIGGAADPDGLAFIIGYLPAENQVAILTTLPDASHTIGIYQGEEEPEEPEEAVYYSVSSLSLKAIGDAIRAKSGTTDPLGFPDEMVEAINGITTGGGSSEDVRYVTFMNGSEVLCVKPVAVGDDCADVIARGLIGTPTKESTAQYDYTYSGWSLTDGGSASSAALSSVTENRTVYAAYTSAVRYYTVTFYDDDGETVLKTQSMTYGSTPSYTPKKDNFLFVAWTPAITAVTGDASYIAQWEESEAFADASWEKIAEVAASGKAQEYYSVGDTKTVGTHTYRIIGFNHDDLADGSGKAPITIALTDVWSTSVSTLGTYNASNPYGNSSVHSSITAKFNELPNALRGVIKEVTKKCVLAAYELPCATITAKTWALSATELGVHTHPDVEGATYTYYDGIAYTGRAASKDYWTRTMTTGKNATMIRANGTTAAVSSWATTGKACLLFGFCI